MPQRPRGRTGKTRAREARAWELSTKGFSTRKIATILGNEGLGPISHVSVAAALKRVEKDIAPEMEQRAMYHRGFQIEALLHIFRESMAAWRRSIKTGDKSIRRKTHTQPPGALGIFAPGQRPPPPPRGGVPMDYVIESLEEYSGHSPHLRRALEALRDLRQLLGMNAPTRTEVVIPTPMGDQVVVYLPDNNRDPNVTILGDAPNDDGPRGITGPTSSN